jgi:hypothetical protein
MISLLPFASAERSVRGNSRYRMPWLELLHIRNPYGA